eukprot:gene16873-biopygen9351
MTNRGPAPGQHEVITRAGKFIPRKSHRSRRHGEVAAGAVSVVQVFKDRLDKTTVPYPEFRGGWFKRADPHVTENFFVEIGHSHRFGTWNVSKTASRGEAAGDISTLPSQRTRIWTGQVRPACCRAAARRPAGAGADPRGRLPGFGPTAPPPRCSQLGCSQDRDRERDKGQGKGAPRDRVGGASPDDIIRYCGHGWRRRVPLGLIQRSVLDPNPQRSDGAAAGGRRAPTRPLEVAAWAAGAGVGCSRHRAPLPCQGGGLSRAGQLGRQRAARRTPPIGVSNHGPVAPLADRAFAGRVQPWQKRGDRRGMPRGQWEGSRERPAAREWWELDWAAAMFRLLPEACPLPLVTEQKKP